MADLTEATGGKIVDRLDKLVDLMEKDAERTDYNGNGKGDKHNRSYGSVYSKYDFDPIPIKGLSDAIAKGAPKVGSVLGSVIGKAAGASLGPVGSVIAGKIGDAVGKAVGKAVAFTAEAVKDASDVWEKIQVMSFQTARNMGLAQEQAKSMNKNLRKEIGLIAAEFDLTMDEIMGIQDGYTQAIGRNVVLSQEQMENAASFKKVLGSTYDEAIANFDELGASTDTAGAYLELTQERAARSGLNAKKASEAFARNIALANKYTFREGVNGLSKMTLLSQKLRVDMNSIASAADKFNSIEGSIETSANLQVLGGSYAYNFSNPLEMMGLATMDFEGFQQKIVDAVKGKGVLNKKTGVVEFSPIDKAFMREAAKQLGMSQEELTKMASRQVSIAEIEKHVNQQLSKSNQDAIANLAEFNADTGKYEVTYYDDGEAKSIAIDDSRLTDDLVKTILPYTDKEDSMRMDVADIAGNVRTLVGKSRSRVSETLALKERREGWNASMDAGVADWMPVDAFKSFHSKVGEVFSGWVKENPTLWGLVRTVFGGFSNGGLIPGADNGGKDNTLAMVAPNEMVLNQQQQSNIYQALSESPNVPHFSEGGISGLEQQQLFNFAQQGNTNTLAPNSQRGESRSTMAVLASGYLTSKTVVNNKPLIDTLNRFGRTFNNGVNRLNIFGKVFTKASTFLNNGKMVNAITNFAKNNRVAHGISNVSSRITNSSLIANTNRILQNNAVTRNVTTLAKGVANNSAVQGGLRTAHKVGQTANVGVRFVVGKNSQIGKRMTSVKQLAKGDLGSAVKTIANNNSATRAYRTARVVANGKSGLLMKSSRGRQALGDIARIWGKQGKTTATFTSKAISTADKLKAVQRMGMETTNPKVFERAMALEKKLLSQSTQATKATSTISNVVNNSKSILQEGAQATKATSKISNVINSSKTLIKEGGTLSKIAQGTKGVLKGGGVKALASSPLKTLTKGTKALGPLGTAISVGFAGYEAYNAVKDFGASKEAILNDETLSEKEKRQQIRGIEDQRNKSVGSAVGGVVGATIGAALLSEIPVIGTAVGAIAGQWVGEKVGGFIGESYNSIKDFLVGSKAEDQMSEADIAQQQYEEQKFGAESIAKAMEDTSGDSIKILAAQATVKMSDLLTSIWHHMNGKLANGEDKHVGLLGGIGNFASSAVKGTASLFGGIFGGLFGRKQASPTTISTNGNTSGATIVGEFSNEDLKDPQIMQKGAVATCQILALLNDHFGVTEENEKKSYLSAFTTESWANTPTATPMSVTPITNDNTAIARTENTSTIVNGGSIGEETANITPRTTVGEPTYIRKVEVSTPNVSSGWDYSNQKQDINLNVNGTLRIVGNNGSGSLDMGALLNSPEFKRQIIDMVQKGLEERANMGGRRNANSIAQVRGGATSITQQNSR